MSTSTGSAWRLTLGALLLLAVCASPVRGAPPPEASSASDGYPCSGEGVYLYEDIDYGGACIKFTADDPELGDDGWHDRASSIKFVGFNYSGGRASATLYEHAYYSGASWLFAGDNPWLGNYGINDTADSIRVLQLPFCDMVSQIPRAECEALIVLYNTTGGPYWVNRNGWLASYLPCSWYGVTCSGGHVSELAFTANNLQGHLPAQLAALTALERLVLAREPLTGSIPPALGSLQYLRVLSLYMCGFTGSIPPELGNLSNLDLLVLGDDQLTGTIPAELGSLAKLATLAVSNNPGMSGPLPQSLTNLALEAFHFEGTSLCVPQDPAFEAWLLGIPNWKGTGISCAASTPTATLVHTPTRTRTRTPWPTPPGGPKRLVLPLLLRVR